MHYDDQTRAEQDSILRREAADAQALADVRTLDDWAMHGRSYQVRQREVVAAADGQFVCELYDDARAVRHHSGHFVFDAETPDEARAKAAAWVREQKP